MLAGPWLKTTAVYIETQANPKPKERPFITRESHTSSDGTRPIRKNLFLEFL